MEKAKKKEKAKTAKIYETDLYKPVHDYREMIAELVVTKHSERQLRIIDHDQDGSMELKKREGYFYVGLVGICTAGSVDDGKSTLIGRLLYDSRAVYEDQLSAVEKASKNRVAGPIDFSLFTDGLKAEREQGITIDVAYRYFATARRKFILADTPGHEQYTRNMATGARRPTSRCCWSTPVTAFARSRGGTPRSRVSWASTTSCWPSTRWISSTSTVRLRRHRGRLRGPVAGRELAPDSDQRAARRQRHHPERSHAVVPGKACSSSWRPSRSTATRPPSRSVFPCSSSSARTDVFRGYAGQIASGTIRVGDAVTILPSGRTSKVKRIVTWDGDIEMAHAPMSVTLTIDDEIDISRGDMMVAIPNRAPGQAPSRLVSKPRWSGWTSGRSIRRASTS